MLTAVLVIAGAVVAWLLVDRLALQRAERTNRSQSRTFHSTGWEETVPPLEVNDVGSRPGSGPQSRPRRERAEDRAAA